MVTLFPSTHTPNIFLFIPSVFKNLLGTDITIDVWTYKWPMWEGNSILIFWAIIRKLSNFENMFCTYIMKHSMCQRLISGDTLVMRQIVIHFCICKFSYISTSANSVVTFFFQLDLNSRRSQLLSKLVKFWRKPWFENQAWLVCPSSSTCASYKPYSPFHGSACAHTHL